MLKTISRFAIILGLVGAGMLRAQTSGDARWSAWLGCWRTAEADGPTTCVVPSTKSSAVDVLTIVNGQIDSRYRIDADSQPHPIDRSGCRGTEIARWSPTGRRVYRRDDLVCGGVNGTSTTLMAISTNGEWLNVEGVRAGAGSLERLDRFHDAGLPTTIPKDVRAAISRRQLAISTARAAAAAPITEADVLEANAIVEPGVVRSWLAESGAAAVLAELASPPRQTQATYPDASAGGAPYAPACVPTGCYAPNPYSDYNGYSVYPYGVYSSFYAGNPWGYRYAAPLIIVHGSTRPPVHAGHEPPRHEPSRHEPMSPPPARHEPPRSVPSVRARP
jgi:hypothetical protein